MIQCSIFEYLYRDASNYKSWGTLILCGSATAADIQILQEKFESGISNYLKLTWNFLP